MEVEAWDDVHVPHSLGVPLEGSHYLAGFNFPHSHSVVRACAHDIPVVRGYLKAVNVVLVAGECLVEGRGGLVAFELLQLAVVIGRSLFF